MICFFVLLPAGSTTSTSREVMSTRKGGMLRPRWPHLQRLVQVMLVFRQHGRAFFPGVAQFGLAFLGVAQSQWFSGPLVLSLSSDLLVLWCPGPLVPPGPLVLWSLDPLVFGCRFWKVRNTANYTIAIFLVSDMLRLLRSQETANTVSRLLQSYACCK